MYAKDFEKVQQCLDYSKIFFGWTAQCKIKEINKTSHRTCSCTWMGNYSLTISCATTSGTSFSKSNVNSMAPLSLYFPFNFLWSSTHSLRAIEAFFPSSSSASSTLTPVSSAKNAWFNKSFMVYLGEGTVKLRFWHYSHGCHSSVMLRVCC